MSGPRLAAIGAVLVLGVVAVGLLRAGEDGSDRSGTVETQKRAAADTTADARAGRVQLRESTREAEGLMPSDDASAPKAPLFAPQVRARRVGRDAIIGYEYSKRQWERLPAGAGLVLAVRGSEQGSLPRSVLFGLTRRSGERRVGLPRSAGPYVVHAQTLAGEKAQGKPITVRLH